jgi:hypothetical protein
MEAGAAERTAHGQRRERVTDWPLMGASEYKHVVLGPIFLSTSRTLLKYVEDAIDGRRAVLRDERAADGITSHAAEELLESRDEYAAEGVFWVSRKPAGSTSISGPSSQRSVSSLIMQWTSSRSTIPACAAWF